MKKQNKLQINDVEQPDLWPITKPVYYKVELELTKELIEAVLKVNDMLLVKVNSIEESARLQCILATMGIWWHNDGLPRVKATNRPLLMLSSQIPNPDGSDPIFGISYVTNAEDIMLYQRDITVDDQLKRLYLSKSLAVLRISDTELIKDLKLRVDHFDAAELDRSNDGSFYKFPSWLPR